MKGRWKWLTGFAMLVACVTVNAFACQTPEQRLASFLLQDKYRAWQGVTVDTQYIYVLTDRNESFGLENIISAYSHAGEKLREWRNAYSGVDSGGRFMSFGDGNLIDRKLYVTAYNANSGGRPLESRVVVFSVPDMKLVSEYDIGGSVAESVTKHNQSYWVTYHDKMEVGEFDLGFHPLRSYALSEPMGEYGGYQGAYWDGNFFLAQMHGPNEPGLRRSKGLDRYRFDGDKFVFIRTEEPLGYGTGQGVARYGQYLLQNDRPANSIVVKESN